MVKEKHQEHFDNEKLISFEVIFKNLLNDLVFYSLREITLILPCVTYKKKKILVLVCAYVVSAY